MASDLDVVAVQITCHANEMLHTRPTPKLLTPSHCPECVTCWRPSQHVHNDVLHACAEPCIIISMLLRFILLKCMPLKPSKNVCMTLRHHFCAGAPHAKSATVSTGVPEACYAGYVELLLHSIPPSGLPDMEAVEVGTSVHATSRCADFEYT